MSQIYLIDADQMAVLRRVNKQLYNDMVPLRGDLRRDVANAMEAVLHSIETLGPLTDEEIAGTHGPNGGKK